MNIARAILPLTRWTPPVGMSIARNSLSTGKVTRMLNSVAIPVVRRQVYFPLPLAGTRCRFYATHSSLSQSSFPRTWNLLSIMGGAVIGCAVWNLLSPTVVLAETTTHQHAESAGGHQTQVAVNITNNSQTEAPNARRNGKSVNFPGIAYLRTTWQERKAKMEEIENLLIGKQNNSDESTHATRTPAKSSPWIPWVGAQLSTHIPRVEGRFLNFL